MAASAKGGWDGAKALMNWINARMGLGAYKWHVKGKLFPQQLKCAIMEKWVSIWP